jgi:glycoside/pentoside/hexuronide:cation symporter, GPH family
MVVSFFAVMPIVRAFGKVRASIILSIGSALFVVSTYSLRLLGIFPEVGSSALLPLFLLLNTIGTGLGICSLMIGASMMSDVVEASEERTGRREEGLFFAGALLMQKASTALGIGIAGLLLQWAQFPASALPGRVAVEVLDRYTLGFIVVTLVLGALSALAVRRFPFGEAEHRARVAKLAVASEI